MRLIKSPASLGFFSPAICVFCVDNPLGHSLGKLLCGPMRNNIQVNKSGLFKIPEHTILFNPHTLDASMPELPEVERVL